MPMLYAAHYALSFILHADYFKPAHQERRQRIVKHMKEACTEREDPLEYLQTGKPRAPPTANDEQAQQTGGRPQPNNPVFRISKFDPFAALKLATKVDKKKTFADVVKDNAPTDLDEIQ